MEYINVTKNLVPRYHPWFKIVESRTLAVVNDTWWTQSSSLFEEVGSDALPTPTDMAGIKTHLTEFKHTGHTHCILWQTGDIAHLVA